MLREQILRGEYSSGDRIPTERELGETYGISRITTRHALRMLEEQGLIQRLPGKGTFVRANRSKKVPITDGDYTGSMRRSSQNILRRLHTFGIEQPPDSVREALGLLPGEACVRAVRVDEIDNVPVAYDHAYFPERFRDTLDDRLLIRVDFLRSWLDRAGVRLSYSRESIEAVRATPEASGLLRVPPNDPLLLTTEVMFDVHGVAIHVAESYYHGERFRLVETISAEKLLGHDRVEP